MATARTLGDYLRLGWDLFSRPGKPAARLSHQAVRHSVRIDSLHHSQPVQADGEVIGRTPVQITLVPRALRVFAPARG